MERPGPGAGAGRWVLLEVEDTGVGIPPALQAQVFNPFFTTKPGGTGLGLATAHRIVEDHGGTIAFRSAPGQGTTFSVLLPVAGPRPQEAEAAAPPPLRLAP